MTNTEKDLKVSIVMPAYNRAAYLAETINSIIGQTFKYWELIIVDDGSTDSSQYIYDYYTKKDPRIRVVYIQHSGISTARITGCEEAKGRYIAVMDSDDLMVNERLEIELKEIKGHDFVYSNYLIYTGDVDKITEHKAVKNVTFEDVKRNGAYPHVTIMAKRECFKDAYREDFKVNDDAWAVWQFFKRGYKAKHIDKPLVLVRIHPGNVTKEKAEAIAKTQEVMDKEYEDSRNTTSR